MRDENLLLVKKLIFKFIILLYVQQRLYSRYIILNNKINLFKNYIYYFKNTTFCYA